MSTRKHRQRDSTPDFLGIGLAKTGSSWLHRTLNQHPDPWMPVVKEINYFSRRESGQLFCKRDEFKFNVQMIFRNIRYGKLFKAWWRLKFIALPRTPGWYFNLFYPACGQVCGDISPNYSRIENVGQVKKTLPHAKILLGLRHPVDRAWSALRMAIRNPMINRDKDILDLTPASQYARLRTFKWILMKNMDVYERWSQYYGHQVIPMFFDELVNDPGKYFEKVAGALGLQADFEGFDSRPKGEATDPYDVMDPELRRLLTRHFLDDIRKTHEIFGSYATTWYQDAQKLLDQDDQPERTKGI